MKAICQEPSSSSVEKNEQYMGSAEWMNKHGLKARKLDLYDVLATCSFKHCDGVVDLRRAPDNDYTDAVGRAIEDYISNIHFQCRLYFP